MMDQVSDNLVFRNDGTDRTLRRFDEDTESEGRVAQFASIVQGLERQANAKIAAIPFKDSQSPSHNVVKNLISAPVLAIVDSGCVVLHVDPVGDEHGTGHDGFQYGAVGITGALIFMQEDAALQIKPSAAVTWRDEKCGIVGESPLGPYLGPIPAPGPEMLQENLLRHGTAHVDSDRGSPFCTRPESRLLEPGLQAREVRGMTLG